MAINDKYRLTSNMTYLGQTCVNVWHFFQSAGSGGAAELGVEFKSAYVNEIAKVMNVGVSIAGATIVNLDDFTDFADVLYGTPVAGIVSGEGAPSFVSWTFRLRRTSRQFRNGYKRFVGVSESSVVGNAAAAAFEATLAALATSLSADLDDGSNTWRQIIARYTGTPPAVSAFDTVKSVSYSHIGSQVSRKLGQGA